MLKRLWIIVIAKKMQFDIMPERGTIGAVIIMRRLKVKASR